MVRRHYGLAKAAEIAVKFGPRRSIAIESHNYTHYVAPYIHNSTRIENEKVWSCGREDKREQEGIGALAYTFVGGNVKSVETLRKYYQDKSVTNDQLCKTLDHLFSMTCEKWYREGHKVAKQKPTRLDLCTGTICALIPKRQKTWKRRSSNWSPIVIAQSNY